MALSWSFIVVIFAISAGFSEAQNATSITAISTSASPTLPAPQATLTAAPTTSTTVERTQIAATPTVSVAPASSTVGSDSSSTGSTLGFYLYLMVSFTSSECDSKKDDMIRSNFTSYFTDRKQFDLANISIGVKTDPCRYDVVILFGPKLMMYNNISEVFKKKHESLGEKLELKDLTIKVYVPGIVLGEWKAKDEDCKKKCGEGAGGPITVSRKCEPSGEKCKKLKHEKEVPDCSKFCASGVTCKISLLVLLFGAFMNWLLK